MSFCDTIITNLDLVDIGSNLLTIHFNDGTSLEGCYLQDLTETTFLAELQNGLKTVIFISSIKRIETYFTEHKKFIKHLKGNSSR